MALTDSTISTKFLIDPLDLIQDEWTRKGSKMKSKNKIYLGNNSRMRGGEAPARIEKYNIYIYIFLTPEKDIQVARERGGGGG